MGPYRRDRHRGRCSPQPRHRRNGGHGLRVTHLYGLTETYGPASVCAWQDDWLTMPTNQKASMLARQGVRYPTLAYLTVANPETLIPVPEDGQTIGEIMMRGNTVMKGYLKNPGATDEAFAGGWFHSGDLAVVHPDHYIEIKDRSKDIIISGGENISSLEVEEVLYRHPKVMEAAVVAKHDEKWGETPCAFVTPRPDTPDITEEELVLWCRDNLAHFKAPGSLSSAPCPRLPPARFKSSLSGSAPTTSSRSPTPPLHNRHSCGGRSKMRRGVNPGVGDPRGTASASSGPTRVQSKSR